jgi:ketosteroid isomerase-like protein
MAPFVRLWDAYGRGRLDDALDLFDQACEVRAARSDRVYHGHDGVRAAIDESRRRWKSITLTSEEIVEVDGATIVAMAHLTAFDHSGARVYDEAVAWLVEFEDGRLVRATFFPTRAEALAAAERPAGNG